MVTEGLTAVGISLGCLHLQASSKVLEWIMLFRTGLSSVILMLRGFYFKHNKKKSSQACVKLLIFLKLSFLENCILGCPSDG